MLSYKEKDFQETKGLVVQKILIEDIDNDVENVIWAIEM